jgi:hypothetical protein
LGFSRLQTVSSDTLSSSVSVINLSAMSDNVQRARPSGGSLQAMLTNFAFSLAESNLGCPVHFSFGECDFQSVFNEAFFCSVKS